jgi:acetoin utilization deacetylase AcuC-like enzyme
MRKRPSTPVAIWSLHPTRLIRRIAKDFGNDSTVKFNYRSGLITLKLFYTDHFELPLPDGHRFPMSKYRLLRDRVVSNPVHQGDVLLVPPAVSREQLCLAHCSSYVDRVVSGRLSTAEIKRIGFPWSEQMVERSLRSSGATLAAARAALVDGFAVNMAGGTHHAMYDAGEGFCVFNDAAVTIRNLLH